VRQTFACRVGLGLRAAIAEARHWSSRCRWYLKMDVRHYFETVPRDRLLSKVERLFGERELISWWADVIQPPGQAAERGMPIGAITRQDLANVYLGFLDRVIKEEKPSGQPEGRFLGSADGTRMRRMTRILF